MKRLYCCRYFEIAQECFYNKIQLTIFFAYICVYIYGAEPGSFFVLFCNGPIQISHSNLNVSVFIIILITANNSRF